MCEPDLSPVQVVPHPVPLPRAGEGTLHLRGWETRKMGSAFPLPSGEGQGEGEHWFSTESNVSITPSLFRKISSFQKRTTRQPCCSSHTVRRKSESEPVCWPPSASTTTLHATQAKSAMKG